MFPAAGPKDFLLYFAIYSVQLDLTSAINTNSLVSVDMRETKKKNESKETTATAALLWPLKPESEAFQMFILYK